MKHRFTIAILCWVFAACSARAYQVQVFDFAENESVGVLGDSLLGDGDGLAPQTGEMWGPYVESAVMLGHPNWTNFNFYVLANSGSQIDNQPSSQAVVMPAVAIPILSQNDFNSIPGTNIIITFPTSNGNQTSNGMYLSWSNLLKAPLLTTNGVDANVNEGGWNATHKITYIVMGYVPPTNSPVVTTDPSPFIWNNAATNAGAHFGLMGLDIFSYLVTYWTNGANGAIIARIYYTGNKAGHIGPFGEFGEAVTFFRLTTTDTNISLAIVDWNTTTPVSTNHCVISSINRSGNTMTFNRLDDRLPMAFDKAGSIDLLGNVTTNDCTDDFILNPDDANFFHFDQGVTNLPVGIYDVRIDGVLVAHALPNSALANWNMFTNTVGPYWLTRTETLGRIRDKDYANRVSFVRGPSGDGKGVIGFGSLASTKWPTHHGDDLLTNTAPSGTSLNNYIWGLKTNSVGSFSAIRASAQPTTHTFAITLIAPLVLPFHR